jgi:hypothetical protein
MNLVGGRPDRVRNAIQQSRTVHLYVDKEQAYLSDRKQVEDFYATRKRNDANVKFCWK